MWHEYPDLQTCIDTQARDIAAHIRAHLKGADFCTVAVSGGRSPIPLFMRLACMDIDWARVRLRMVDERYVPPSHPDSNEALVRKYLLTNNGAAADFRGLYLPGASIAEAVEAANLDAKPIDIALLGMGDDGHTASLFPGAPQLKDALDPAAAYYLHVTPPNAPHERITLSLAALRGCDDLVLYIAGAHKREVLRQAEKQISERLPISQLAADPGVRLDVHWHP